MRPSLKVLMGRCHCAEVVPGSVCTAYHVFLGALAMLELCANREPYSPTLLHWLVFIWVAVALDLVWALSSFCLRRHSAAHVQAFKRGVIHHLLNSLLVAVLLTRLFTFLSATGRATFNAQRHVFTGAGPFVEDRVSGWFRAAMVLLVATMPAKLDAIHDLLVHSTQLAPPDPAPGVRKGKGKPRSLYE